MNIIRVTHPTITGLPTKDFISADLIFHRPDQVWWKPWQKPSILKNKNGPEGKCSFKHLNDLINASGNTKIFVCETSG